MILFLPAPILLAAFVTIPPTVDPMARVITAYLSVPTVQVARGP